MLEKIVLLAYIAYIIIMSLASFALFLKDKKMAVNNGNEVRIKEKTLLATALFGGALGAFLGRIVAHHKTNKTYFSIVIILSLILQALTLVALVYSVLA